MRRTTLLALGAAAALAAAPAFAQAPTPQAEPGSAAPAVTIDRSALVDARIAALRAGLRLTPEQEPLFAPVEDALRARAAAMEERRAAMRERMAERTAERADAPGGERPRERMRGRADGDVDFMQRLERYSTAAQARATQTAAVTDALRPLWDTLDASQQALLPVLMRESGALGETRRSGRYGHHGRYGQGRYGHPHRMHGRG